MFETFFKKVVAINVHVYYIGYMRKDKIAIGIRISRQNNKALKQMLKNLKKRKVKMTRSKLIDNIITIYCGWFKDEI